MAIQTSVNFNADATKQIAFVNKPSNGATAYQASIAISGTFGGGSVTLKASLDGGTTIVSLTGDAYGTIPTYSSACIVNVSFGNGNKNNATPLLYATLAGSTSPNLNITVCDNVG